MGYFNYFIKCIIRKFVNTIFKPKVLLFIFIIIFVLYLLGGSSRAEWTDVDIVNLENTLNDMSFTLSQQLEKLDNISGDTGIINNNILAIGEQISTLNTSILDLTNMVDSLKSYSASMNIKLSNILGQVETINTNILNIYNKLDENQQELLQELEEDNQAVLNELNMIRDAINGTEEEQDTFIDNGSIPCGSHTAVRYYLKCISLNYEPRYTYTIKVNYDMKENYAYRPDIAFSDNLIPRNYDWDSYSEIFRQLPNVPKGTGTFTITYNIPVDNFKYIYLTYSNNISSIEIYRNIQGIVDSLNQSNNLQQQQNQLQQEQNNFLKQEQSDSDVSVDNFNSVDSNDITSAGLNGVFNTIYSSISSWSSKNINLPIPYTNKSIIIPANYTENMLNNSGGSWIITFIHTIYYFIVGRFMIYSITNIINSIKSGSILNTDSKNNITTDML